MSYPNGGYGQPQNGRGGYQPGYPGYSAVGPDSDDRPRANPVAGILLLIGAIAGLAACLIPNSTGKLPVVSAIDVLREAGNSIPLSTGLFVGLAPLVLALGSLLALLAGFIMFRAGSHGGAAATGLIGSLLMLGCPALLMVASDGQLFHGLDVMGWTMVAAWAPALIGALLGFRK